MRVYKSPLFGVAIGMLLLSGSTTAQGPANTELPAVVVQRAAAAHGNKWASNEIADWVADGKLTLFGPEGPKMTFDVALLRKGALQVQRVIKQPAGELKQGSDGTRSWESIAGFYTPSAQGQTLQFIESQTVRSPRRLLDHQAEGLILRDAGSDARTRVIEAIDRQGKRTSYTIDADTSRITKLEFVVGQARDAFSGKLVDVFDTYVSQTSGPSKAFSRRLRSNASPMAPRSRKRSSGL